METSPTAHSKRRILEGCLVFVLLVAVGGWWFYERSVIDDLEDRSGIYYHYGMVAEMRGFRLKAKQNLTEALEQNIDDPLSNYLMGYILAKEGEELETAYAHLQKALAGGPDDWIAYEAIGLVYYQRGKFIEAIDWCERGLTQKRGKNIYIYDRLADAQWQLGEHAAAIESWKLALHPPELEKWEQLTEQEIANQEAGDALFALSELFEIREDRMSYDIREKIEAVQNGKKPIFNIDP